MQEVMASLEKTHTSCKVLQDLRKASNTKSWGRMMNARVMVVR